MTFLPVAHRELLAASRRKATFRMRIWASLIASGLAFLMLVFIGISGSGPRSGQVVFYTLVIAGHFFAFIAGLFLTADSIATERRDGTLGFLFLTDLNGVDIIAGKLAGAMLGALYALVAMLPVLSIAWFIGGISNGEFWRNCIALLNELFVAAAIGMAASARSTRLGAATGLAVLIAAIGVLLLPVLMGLGDRFHPHPLWGHVAAISPANLLQYVREPDYAARPGMFYLNLGLSHAIGWILLAYASIAVQQGWRQQAQDIQATRAGTPLGRISVNVNPAQVLIGGRTVASRTALHIAIGTLLVAFGLAILNGQMGSIFAVLMPLLLLAGIAIRGLMVWDITIFIGEARRTGTLELLLTTPIQDDHISRAVHAHALRQYALPAGLVAFAEICTAAGLGRLESVVPNLVGTLIQCLCVPTVALWYALTEPKPTVAFFRTFGPLVALATPLNYLCCIGLALPPYYAARSHTRLRLPFREILSGVRSHWQRRDGWLYPTTPPARQHPGPPPLPYQRE